ncbi:hypothetical protein EU537_09490 [Candidatus Thorarchaeota archaeon]|nr:MAG: hypothetical protein EU537_09490 [Candidatus Thorarchaeota archaeon]
MQEVQAYGVSASCVRDEISTIMGAQMEDDSVRSEKTGEVKVQPEIYSSTVAYCAPTASTDSCEGAALCIIIIGVIMALFAVVWAIVMLAFSIMTFGGFIKRRYRTIVLFEKEHKPFLSKLALLSVRNEGVINYPLGIPMYDEWMRRTFGLFSRKKYMRQLSLFLAGIWGLLEVGFKLNQILFDPTFSYNLWPLRIVMVAIFLPLLFYAPILEIQFRRAFDKGKEIVDRVLLDEPSYRPDPAPDTVSYQSGLGKSEEFFG